MSESKHSWLKGDLPTWVASGLMLILAYGGKQFVDHLNGRLLEHGKAIADISKMLAEREPRYMALEKQNEFNRELIQRLEQGQREVVAELKAINVQLKRQ
jgi:hypothetical protein